MDDPRSVPMTEVKTAAPLEGKHASVASTAGLPRLAKDYDVWTYMSSKALVTHPEATQTKFEKLGGQRMNRNNAEPANAFDLAIDGKRTQLAEAILQGDIKEIENFFVKNEGFDCRFSYPTIDKQINPGLSKILERFKMGKEIVKRCKLFMPWTLALIVSLEKKDFDIFSLIVKHAGTIADNELFNHLISTKLQNVEIEEESYYFYWYTTLLKDVKIPITELVEEVKDSLLLVHLKAKHFEVVQLLVEYKVWPHRMSPLGREFAALVGRGVISQCYQLMKIFDNKPSTPPGMDRKSTQYKRRQQLAKEDANVRETMKYLDESPFGSIMRLKFAVLFEEPVDVQRELAHGASASHYVPPMDWKLSKDDVILLFGAMIPDLATAVTNPLHKDKDASQLLYEIVLQDENAEKLGVTTKITTGLRLLGSNLSALHTAVYTGNLGAVKAIQDHYQGKILLMSQYIYDNLDEPRFPYYASERFSHNLLVMALKRRDLDLLELLSPSREELDQRIPIENSFFPVMEQPKAGLGKRKASFLTASLVSNSPDKSTRSLSLMSAVSEDTTEEVDGKKEEDKEKAKEEKPAEPPRKKTLLTRASTAGQDPTTKRLPLSAQQILKTDFSEGTPLLCALAARNASESETDRARLFRILLGKPGAYAAAKKKLLQPKKASVVAEKKKAIVKAPSSAVADKDEEDSGLFSGIADLVDDVAHVVDDVADAVEHAVDDVVHDALDQTGDGDTIGPLPTSVPRASVGHFDKNNVLPDVEFEKYLLDHKNFPNSVRIIETVKSGGHHNRWLDVRETQPVVDAMLREELKKAGITSGSVAVSDELRQLCGSEENFATATKAAESRVLIEVLMDQGADPNTMVLKNGAFTPLVLCMFSSCVKLLDPELKKSDGKKADGKKPSVFSPDDELKKELLLCVDVLGKFGYNFDNGISNYGGLLPIYMVTVMEPSLGLEFLKLALKYKADPNVYTANNGLNGLVKISTMGKHDLLWPMISELANAGACLSDRLSLDCLTVLFAPDADIDVLIKLFKTKAHGFNINRKIKNHSLVHHLIVSEIGKTSGRQLDLLKAVKSAGARMDSISDITTVRKHVSNVDNDHNNISDVEEFLVAEGAGVVARFFELFKEFNMKECQDLVDSKKVNLYQEHDLATKCWNHLMLNVTDARERLRMVVFLRHACGHCNYKITKPGTKDTYSPLAVAVRENDTDLVVELCTQSLENDVCSSKVDVPAYGNHDRMIIVDAILHGNVEIVRILCSNGYVLNSQDETCDLTPLTIAVIRDTDADDYLPIIKELLKYKADPMLPRTSTAISATQAIVQVLTLEPTNENLAYKERLREALSLFAVTKDESVTPLLLAALRVGDVALFGQLLHKYFEHDAFQETLAHIRPEAFKIAIESRQTNLIEVLLEFKANPGVTLGGLESPYSALAYAAKCNCVEIVKLLLKGGCDVDALMISEREGDIVDENTALGVVLHECEEGDAKTVQTYAAVIKVLIAHGADPDIVKNKPVDPDDAKTPEAKAKAEFIGALISDKEDDANEAFIQLLFNGAANYFKSLPKDEIPKDLGFLHAEIEQLLSTGASIGERNKHMSEKLVEDSLLRVVLNRANLTRFGNGIVVVMHFLMHNNAAMVVRDKEGEEYSVLDWLVTTFVRANTGDTSATRERLNAEFCQVFLHFVAKGASISIPYRHGSLSTKNPSMLKMPLLLRSITHHKSAIFQTKELLGLMVDKSPRPALNFCVRRPVSLKKKNAWQNMTNLYDRFNFEYGTPLTCILSLAGSNELKDMKGAEAAAKRSRARGIVRALVNAGADVNVCDGNGVFPIGVICSLPYFQKRSRMLQFLLTNGAEPSEHASSLMSPYMSVKVRMQQRQADLAKAKKTKSPDLEQLQSDQQEDIHCLELLTQHGGGRLEDLFFFVKALHEGEYDLLDRKEVAVERLGQVLFELSKQELDINQPVMMHTEKTSQAWPIGFRILEFLKEKSAEIDSDDLTRFLNQLRDAGVQFNLAYTDGNGENHMPLVASFLAVESDLKTGLGDMQHALANIVTTANYSFVEDETPIDFFHFCMNRNNRSLLDRFMFNFDRQYNYAVVNSEYVKHKRTDRMPAQHSWRTASPDIDVLIALPKFITKNQVITHLELRGCLRGQSQDMMKRVVSAIHNQQRIKVLDLSHNYMGYAIGEFGDLLRKTNTLQTLNLAHNNMTRPICDLVFPALSENTSVTSFNVSGNHLHTHSLKLLATQLANPINSIDTLDVSENHMGLPGIMMFLRYITESGLVSLNLANNQVDATGAIEVARFMLACKTLRKLDLADNDLDTEGLVAVANALVHTEVTHLGLMNTDIESDGVLRLVRMAARSQTLLHLDVRKNPKIQVLGTLALWDLKLNYTVRTIEGLPDLEKMLTQNGADLDIFGHFIGDVRCKILCDALMRNRVVKSLRLRNCHLTDVAVGHICELLKVNSMISTLDISENDGITYKGLQMLADLVIASEKKETAETQHSEFAADDEDEKHVLRASNSTLTSIDVGGPDYGGEEGLKLLLRIREKCPHIVSLCRVRIQADGLDSDSDDSVFNAEQPLLEIGAYMLGHLIESRPEVREVRLMESEIRNHAAQKWAHVLRTHPGLTVALLADAKNSQADMKLIAEAVCSNPKLKEVSLNPELEIPLIQFNAATTVQAIDLSHKALGDAEVIIIAAQLKLNKSVRAVNLSHNAFGLVGVQALADMLKVNDNIRVMDLSYNLLGSESIKALGDMLRLNEGLDQLNLRSTFLLEAPAEPIAAPAKDADGDNTNEPPKLRQSPRKEQKTDVSIEVAADPTDGPENVENELEHEISESEKSVEILAEAIAQRISLTALRIDMRDNGDLGYALSNLACHVSVRTNFAVWIGEEYRSASGSLSEQRAISQLFSMEKNLSPEDTGKNFPQGSALDLLLMMVPMLIAVTFRFPVFVIQYMWLGFGAIVGNLFDHLSARMNQEDWMERASRFGKGIFGGMKQVVYTWVPAFGFAMSTFPLWMGFFIVFFFFHETQSVRFIVFWMGLYFSGLFAFCIMFGYQAAQDQDLQQPASMGNSVRYPWRKGNIVAFVSVLADFYQLSSLAVVPEFYPQEAQEDVGNVYNFASFEVDLGSPFFQSLALYCIVFAVAIWLVIVGFMMISMDRREFRMLNFGSAQVMIALLADTLFFTILQFLLQWVDCTWDVEENPGVWSMDVNPAITCWTGVHSTQASFAMAVLGLYILSTNTIGLYFLEDLGGTEIKYSEFSILVTRNLKFMVVVGNVIFTNNPTVRLVAEIVAYGGLVALYAQKKIQVCTIPQINRIKLLFFLAAFFGSVCSFYKWITQGELIDVAPTGVYDVDIGCGEQFTSDLCNFEQGTCYDVANAETELEYTCVCEVGYEGTWCGITSDFTPFYMLMGGLGLIAIGGLIWIFMFVTKEERRLINANSEPIGKALPCASAPKTEEFGELNYRDVLLEPLENLVHMVEEGFSGETAGAETQDTAGATTETKNQTSQDKYTVSV